MNLIQSVDKIIIHCTASDDPKDNNIDAIRKLHITPKSHDVSWNGKIVAGRGFSAIGYHKIITLDGKAYSGRGEHLEGAHCFGQNQISLAIALCGNKHFSLAQYRKLFYVLDVWKDKYNLTDSDIYGHYAFSQKPCPNFIVNF